MKTKTFSLIVMAFAVTSQVLAQGTPKLELTVAEAKVNLTRAEKSGRAKIMYKPGDVIHYTITAQNVGDGVMTSPVVTDPIPAGVVYVPMSAKGEDTIITFSINSGITYQNWPPTYTVKDADGKEIVKNAPPEMISHIRWELQKPLAPNEKKILEFDVKVK
ncbi:MAG: hypothetical protein M0R34_01830 [Candidatus Marinimicrobia bacterium]|jgi:uncharacterized repeat protein (TIGR01451 family)|nr:hypothetical protein [Candidatus Neomarinimicrobiota bacterium]MCK9559065.1 hypothetical protein [Candidatus Neomarinimicrobiota bacterium]